MKTIRFLLIYTGLVFFCQCALSQTKQDSLLVKKDSIIQGKNIRDTAALPLSDSAAVKKHSPRIAAIRSAILPGLGQAYNRKYWKIPIVYGALGATAYVFTFNLNQYKDIRFAYNVLVRKDTGNYRKVKDFLQPFIEQNATNALRNARNEVRKNIDYSVLVFIIFWGLNVVDATVDANLKGFDVSDELSFKIKPGYNPSSNTTGLSLVFDIHKARPKMFALRH